MSREEYERKRAELSSAVDRALQKRNSAKTPSQFDWAESCYCETLVRYNRFVNPSMTREEYEHIQAELDAEVERTHQAMITGMEARLPDAELDPLKRAACDAEEAYVRFMSLPEHAEYNAAAGREF